MHSNHKLNIYCPYNASVLSRSTQSAYVKTTHVKL